MDKKFLLEPRNIEEISLKELRVLIDYSNRSIIDSIKSRSRLKRNDYIYDKKAIGKSFSLLDYAIMKKEEYYASIGRYMDSAEFPIKDVKIPEDSPFYGKSLKNKNFMIKMEVPCLTEFYKGCVIDKFCSNGNNEGMFGQITDLDVSILELINQRINIGRYVAERKIKEDKAEAIKEILKSYNPQKKNMLRKLLSCKQRESDVLTRTKEYATGLFVSNQTNPREVKSLENKIENLFSSIISKTINLEIDHLVKIAFLNKNTEKNLGI